MDPKQVICDEVCAMDNQDVPVEDYPQRLVDALARAGWAVVPVPMLRECEQALSDMTGTYWPARAELLGRVRAALMA